MKLTDKRIAEIKAAEAAATERPWRAADEYVYRNTGVLIWAMTHGPNENNDAAFIALARTAVPDLLVDREALTAKIERWKIQYEREAVQGDKFADIIERIASEGKKDRARAEAAESENAALAEKVERLEKKKQSFCSLCGVMAMCHTVDSERLCGDCIYVCLDNTRSATTRAETAEANLAEAKAQGAASLADLLLKPEWLNRIQIDGIDSAGLLSQALDELDNQRVTQ